MPSKRPLGIGAAAGVCILLIAAAVAPGGCASAPINKQAALDLAKADALVVDGCYACLVDAHDIYARVGVAKARPFVVQRLYETTLLLALREKELARDPAKWIGEAQALAPELPPTYNAASYLRLVQAMPGDPWGGNANRDVAAMLEPFRRSGFTTLTDAMNNRAASALFLDYLRASVDCTTSSRSAATAVVTPVGAAATGAADATPATSAALAHKAPLLQLRLANCAPPDPGALKAISERPRAADAALFYARTIPTNAAGALVTERREKLTMALAAFPDSPAATQAMAVAEQSAGDCRAALTYYEKTIALKPRHEDAHLGRVMCLSVAQRFTEAVAEATLIIDDTTMGAKYKGEALYWRAWNKRELKQLPGARVDSDRMKTLLYDVRTSTLAGQIEHDMDDLDIADKDLADAWRLGRGTNCTAAWYQALVALKREHYPATADLFVKAKGCYESDLAQNQGFLEDMKLATNVDEAYRASQIAGFQAAIREDESQISASCFNAAVNYARAQNREKALEYLELAAKDPSRADAVEQLRKILKGG